MLEKVYRFITAFIALTLSLEEIICIECVYQEESTSTNKNQEMYMFYYKL